MTGTGRAIASTPESAHNAPTNLPAKKNKTKTQLIKGLNHPNTEVHSIEAWDEPRLKNT